MTRKIKAVVIGVGKMGKNHVRTYFETQEVELLAIADLNESLGLAIAEEYKTKFYKDFKQMLAKEKPDLVSICVPTVSHYAVAEYCINREIHTLLEKPITLNIPDGEKLLALARKSNCKLLIGHVERFNPAVKKVKEMIDKKELGKVIAIVARRLGGFPPQITAADIGIDLAIHDIDIVNYLLNDLPKQIYSNRQRTHIKSGEDSIELFLKYKTASAYIQANWITPVKIRKLNITGTDGYLEMDYINQKIEFYKSNYDKFKEKVGNFSDYVLRFSEPDKIDVTVGKREPLKEEINYIVNCIVNDIEIDSSFALDALRIASMKLQ